MTDEEKRQMKQFEAKVRRLISLYQTTQKEVADLYTELERKEADIERLQSELRQSQSDYKNLKVAKTNTMRRRCESPNSCAKLTSVSTS